MSDQVKRTVVERGKNWVLFDDGVMRLEKVRCSYPHYFEMHPPPGTKGSDGNLIAPSFSGTFLLDKVDHKEAVDRIIKLRNKLIDDKGWKSKKDPTKRYKFPAANQCITDGDEKDTIETEGKFVLVSRDKKTQPKVFSKGRKLLESENERGAPYAGCFVNVQLNFYLFEAKGDPTIPRRFLSGLIAVQFAEDGEALGRGRITDERAAAGFDGDDDEDGGFDDDNSAEDDDDDL